MLVFKRWLSIFTIFMIIAGLLVCVRGVWTHLTKPIVILDSISFEWVYPLEKKPEDAAIAQYVVTHLEFSSNYSTTIYIYRSGVTTKLASNVTDLDTRLSGGGYLFFEPSQTPCAMRLKLTFERANPEVGLFSSLGIWLLTVGIGPPSYLWISKKLKEDLSRLILKLTLMLAYFWSPVFIYYIFLGFDPFQPFFVTPVMLSFMLPLAILGMISLVVFGFVVAYYLLVHISFSIKLGFCFLLGVPFLIALVYVIFARGIVFRQIVTPFFLFVANYGVLYVLQTRLEQARSRPWLLPFSLGWMFLLTVFSPLHEFGHYLVAYFDEAAIREATWWWITDLGVRKPNVFVDPKSFSSINAHISCLLAGLLIILLPFLFFLFVWRLKKSDWWHFSFIVIVSSFATSYDDFYRIGMVVQGPLLALCLALVTLLTTGALFSWYFYRKLPFITHENRVPNKQSLSPVT